jgi:hypothetical protein
MTAVAPLRAFSGFRFPREVITLAVRWYLRYGLSYRDVEELLAERGITVDHVTVYRWVQRCTADFIEAARPCRRLPGHRWFVEETYVKISGLELPVPRDRSARSGHRRDVLPAAGSVCCQGLLRSRARRRCQADRGDDRSGANVSPRLGRDVPSAMHMWSGMRTILSRPITAG